MLACLFLELQAGPLALQKGRYNIELSHAVIQMLSHHPFNSPVRIAHSTCLAEFLREHLVQCPVLGQNVLYLVPGA